MIKQLLEIRLRNFLAGVAFTQKSAGDKKKSMGKLVLFAFLMLYVVVVFISLFLMMAIGLATAALPIGADNIYFGFFMMIGFSMIFFFSIFETKSELFDCKDNELLLSMPIKCGDIVIARTAAVLIYNYLELLSVALPAVIVYISFGGSAAGIIGSIIAFLLLPLPATALASGVGFLVAKIEKKFRKNSFVTLALSLAFLALYFIGYSKLMSSSVMNPDTDIPDFSEAIKGMGSLGFIGNIAMLKPLNFALFLAAAAGISYLAYYLIEKNYISIITNSDKVKKAEYKRETLSLSHPFFALTKKELARFISSATYMLNGALGVIFLLAFGAGALVKGDVIREALFDITGVDITLAPLLSAVMILISSMCMVSASAMSLEGESLWILKTLPENPKYIIAAKLMPHLAVTIPASVVTSVMLSIAFELRALDILFIIVTPIIANIFFAVLGLYLNICFPKFKFANEAQVVKQSLAVFLSTMLNMAIGVMVLIASFLAIADTTFISSLVIMLALMVITAVFAYLLFTNGVKKYEKFSV